MVESIAIVFKKINIMKISKLFLLVLIFNFGYGQDFQGEATYDFKHLRTKSILKQVKETKDTKEDVFEKEEMKAAFDKASLKKYTLKISAYNSEFEEMQQLAKPDLGQSDGFSMSISFNKGLLFKDLKTKRILEERYSLDDKDFIVDADFEVFDWKISSETKKIGNYNCIKATATVKVTEKQQKDYQERLKNRKSTSAFLLQPPTDTEIIAWFSNEIPISNGPDKYQGLPGLILELTSKNGIYICSKIVLNPKTKFKIEPPTKGKSISEVAYEQRQAMLLKKLANEDGMIIRSVETKD